MSVVSVLNEFEHSISEASKEDLRTAVMELRELGELLEKTDVHFFEKEKFEDLIREAREVVKSL
ncbi:hypothetical protein [Parageobacillus toebii]|uniref:hypothetical protein n=1 Tax=Parageobacillus toebii TaxID=153151 RepID=UPI0019675BB6|nr:hypothetical protein [Parageobacillus toebii]QSB48780.1 hypothetical protein JTI59_17225 [Parageobacillus toebii]